MMKDYKIHIAVVDDGINEEYYDGCELEYNLEVTDELTVVNRYPYDKAVSSHGSICAAIICKYVPQARIGSVKILNGNRRSEADRLVRAIEWCTDNGINIVNLSLGTVYFKDFHRIRTAVEKAIGKGIIIIAACSNSGRMTYPAYITDVIGVKCDDSGTLSEGEYSYHYFPNDGINITAYSNILIQTSGGVKEYAGVCNSYAAAFITSRVCGILTENRNSSLYDVNRELAAGSVNRSEKDDSGNLKKEIDWVHNAVLFEINREKAEHYRKNFIFHAAKTVTLEYNSTDKLIRDIRYHLNVQIKEFDTIILDLNGVKLSEPDYNPGNIISELSGLHKNIVYLDDRETEKKPSLKLSDGNIKIWHPSIIKLLNYPVRKRLDVPLITVHDLTGKHLFSFLSEIQAYFRQDGYYITSVADQCYGKLFGFEFIPVYGESLSGRQADFLEFITGFYHPDILLIGSGSMSREIEKIDKLIEIDISIVITEKIDDNVMEFINIGKKRLFLLISDDKAPGLSYAGREIVRYDAAILEEPYELYQYIVGLYEKAQG